MGAAACVRRALRQQNLLPVSELQLGCLRAPLGGGGCQNRLQINICRGVFMLPSIRCGSLLLVMLILRKYLSKIQKYRALILTFSALYIVKLT